MRTPINSLCSNLIPNWRNFGAKTKNDRTMVNDMETNKGEIVMYQPDETIRLEVRMEGETVWLS